ncbi:TBCC domain-containing protein 1 isoform X2 [Hyperolius riggenbachi]|uniref:TBCC domain-containing protein 1 isoform X2 n=1 Tax=Hyperolius riggenbachi TaxID=752182 RepID=UPI0035A342A5
MELYRVQMWARTDPFLIGVLQFPPPAKFSLHYLRKMATYVRTRSSDGCYPRLRWPSWRHIACGKLQLAEDTAWLYFEAFHCLSERSPPKSLEWAEAVSSCRSVEEYDRLKNRNWDDYSHHQFIQNHIPYLLELLLDHDQLTKSSHSSEFSLLFIEAAQALGFLIEGTMDKNRTIHRFIDLATWLPLQSRSGYSKTTESFSMKKLQAWIKECLVVNPFGLSNCIKSGQILAWAQQVDGSSRKAKIACNVYKVPPGNQMVVMSHISKQTLAKSSETLVDARVKLINCNESYIYLLSPLRCVTIEKCRNSTFVLGPVQIVLHVQMCDHVRVISVCQRLSLSSTTSCTFHILTPTRPVLYSGNQSVTFAPYHTHYAMLEDHMGHAGIATLPNYWDRPQFFSTESDSQVWKLMSPREFYTFVVPFEMEGDTTEVPGSLPPAFLKSIEQRQQKVQMWQKTVKEAKLTREQRKKFQTLVEHKFNEWLVKTGNRHQLDSLVPTNDSTKQAAG